MQGDLRAKSDKFQKVWNSRMLLAFSRGSLMLLSVRFVDSRMAATGHTATVSQQKIQLLPRDANRTVADKLARGIMRPIAAIHQLALLVMILG